MIVLNARRAGHSRARFSPAIAAFTMVEAMVVTALIAVLASVGFVTYKAFVSDSQVAAAEAEGRQVAKLIQAASAVSRSAPAPMIAERSPSDSSVTPFTDLPYYRDIPSSVSRLSITNLGEFSVVISSFTCSGLVYSRVEPGASPTGTLTCRGAEASDSGVPASPGATPFPDPTPTAPAPDATPPPAPEPTPTPTATPTVTPTPSSAPAPSAPTDLAASPDNASVSLSWSSEDPEVTDYRIQFRLSSDSDWEPFSDGVSASKSATVTGLANGSSYDFRVAASSPSGTSTYSSPASATPYASLVFAGRYDNVFAVTGSAITPQTPDVTGGYGPKSYSVSPALPAGVSLNVSTGRLSGTPLAPSAAASYVVTVTDSSPDSASDTFTLRTVTPLEFSASYPESLFVVGTPISQLAPSLTGGYGSVVFSVSPSLPSGLSLNPSTGVLSGTPDSTQSSASYTVTATDGQGFSSSATFTVTIVSLPSAPLAVVPTPADGQVSLSWSPPASDGGSLVTDYIVQYKVDSSPTWITFAEGISTSTSAVVTGLANGASYQFQVLAVSAAGQSPASAVSAATPTAAFNPAGPAGSGTPGAFDRALISYTSFTATNNFTVASAFTPAAIYTHGAFACNSTATIGAFVHTYSTATLTNACRVGGIWASGDVNTSTTSPRVDSSVASSSGSLRIANNPVTIGGDVVVAGSVVSASGTPTIGGTVSTGATVAPPPALSLPIVRYADAAPASWATSSWTSFARARGAANGAPAWALTGNMCSVAGASWSVNGPLVSPAVPTVLDARACSDLVLNGSAGAVTLSLDSDLTIVANKFTSNGTLNVVSADGAPHFLRIIVPWQGADSADCAASGSSSVSFQAGGVTMSPLVPTLLYSGGNVALTNGMNFTGQVYGCSVDTSVNVTMNYSQVGLAS